MKKIRLGILLGGKSAEHEVSLLSAKNVLSALDRSKYEITLIAIDKKGSWRLCAEEQFLVHADNLKRIALTDTKEDVALIPSEGEQRLVPLNGGVSPQALDIIFPILHGPYGEDGTVQGLLKLADAPFVGAGVLGSAVGMDKDVMKRLFREAKLPTPKFFVLTQPPKDFHFFEKELGLPLFIKPANLGSSIGISKVKNQEEFFPAIEKAFRYDRKILIEEFIDGIEVECAVIGNEEPVASLPGQVIPAAEYYTYRAKYEENGVKILLPAPLPQATLSAIQELAICAFQVLCCEGMARVDFFVKADGSIFVNEINTIPGFTKTSFFPAAWEASGIPFSKVLDHLIESALKRHEQELSLRTGRDLHEIS